MPNFKYKQLFGPLWIVLPALVVLIALGAWDLQRMQWKTALNEELQIRSRAPAIQLPVDDRLPAADLVYRPVRISGFYLHESEMHLLNRSRDGKPGVAVITPLVRADGGPTLLVDRGWAPAEWIGPAAQGAAVQFQEIEVTGIVLAPEARGLLAQSNDPANNEWHYMDLSAMAGSVGQLPFVDYYLYATGEAPFVPEPVAPADGAAAKGSTPAPVQAMAQSASPYPMANVWRVDMSNDDLNYAVFWFSLAAVLLAGYIVYRTRFTLRARGNNPD